MRTKNTCSTRRSSAPGRSSRISPFVYRAVRSSGSRSTCVKALHEAKVHSSWINPHAEYDRGVEDFVRLILDDPDEPPLPRRLPEVRTDREPFRPAQFAVADAAQAGCAGRPRHLPGDRSLGSSAWSTRITAGPWTMRGGRRCCASLARGDRGRRRRPPAAVSRIDRGQGRRPDQALRSSHVAPVSATTAWTLPRRRLPAAVGQRLKGASSLCLRASRGGCLRRGRRAAPLGPTARAGRGTSGRRTGVERDEAAPGEPRIDRRLAECVHG